MPKAMTRPVITISGHAATLSTKGNFGVRMKCTINSLGQQSNYKPSRTETTTASHLCWQQKQTT